MKLSILTMTHTAITRHSKFSSFEMLEKLSTEIYSDISPKYDLVLLGKECILARIGWTFLNLALSNYRAS